ncbi:carboxymuconolactone decarboxylase family protein [Actinomadura fulvescens]|uniref:carboxymuconolactone decarboxylase family protein n=1 Tax=Actinomadura fulvescens TaxID=46160 RepID=UPI0031D2A30C
MAGGESAFQAVEDGFEAELEAPVGGRGVIGGLDPGAQPRELLGDLDGLRHRVGDQLFGVAAFAKALGKLGADDDKIITVAAWREAPFFDDAERAALELTERLTRVADQSGEAVPDELFDEVADLFDERRLSALVLAIGVTNMFNRINATVREVAGSPSWQG